MPQGIAAAERPKVVPRTEVRWIGLKAASARSARDNRQLSATDGQQGVSQWVWLMKHGTGPPGIERGS